MTPTSIPLADIRPSKTNPRKSYDAAKLAELTASIKTHGVLQPVLVRQNGKGYELVAGERRYRAAKAVGLDALPVTVRELTDVQVLEIQVVENLQRDDLHPLEEAEGYRQLHETHGYAVEDLAAKVGKSKAYVYARLKLCTLPATAKKAFLEGKLSPSAALLVARIPDPKLATEAAGEMARRDMSAREAADLVHRSYMTALSGAPWKKDDATLIPEAGACTACPKRSGNQRDLFPEIKSADVCTDVACFAAKGQAHIARTLETARAEGRTVLEGKKAEAARHSREYIVLDDHCYEGSGGDRIYGKPWRAVLGAAAPEAVLAVRPPQYQGQAQRVVELVPRAAALKAFRDKYPKAKTTPSSNSWERQEKTRRRELQIRKQAGAEAIAQIVTKASARTPGLPFWRWLVAAVMDSVGQAHYEVEKRRGLANAGKNRATGRGAQSLAKAIPTMAEADLRALIVELLATAGIPSYTGASFRAPLTTACALYGVSLKAAETQVRKAAAAKPKKKGKQAAPAGGEKACRECDCTYTTPCAGGCAWVPKAKPPLCTSCA